MAGRRHVSRSTQALPPLDQCWLQVYTLSQSLPSLQVMNIDSLLAQCNSWSWTDPPSNASFAAACTSYHPSAGLKAAMAGGLDAAGCTCEAMQGVFGCLQEHAPLPGCCIIVMLSPLHSLVLLPHPQRCAPPTSSSAATGPPWPTPSSPALAPQVSSAPHRAHVTAAQCFARLLTFLRR